MFDLLTELVTKRRFYMNVGILAKVDSAGC